MLVADEAATATKHNAAQAQKEVEADRNETELVVYHEVTEDVIEDKQIVEAAKTTALVITEISDNSADGSKDVTDEFCTDESFIREQDTEYEIWVVRYTDSSQASTAVDAIINIEETLKNNFNANNIKEEDQVYKIEHAKNSEKSIFIHLKLLKNCPLNVEMSARYIQTRNENLSVQIQEVLR